MTVCGQLSIGRWQLLSLLQPVALFDLPHLCVCPVCTGAELRAAERGRGPDTAGACVATLLVVEYLEQSSRVCAPGLQSERLSLRSSLAGRLINSARSLCLTHAPHSYANR